MLSLGNNISSTQAVEAKYSANFDGTNDYIDTGHHFSDVFNDSFTISFWAKPDDGQPAGTLYFFGTNDSNDDILRAEHKSDGKFVLLLEGNTDTGSFTTNSPVFSDSAATSWTHILISVTKPGSGNSSAVIYINGSSVAISTSSISHSNHALFSSAQNLVICARNNQGTVAGFYAGGMDEWALWNVALDANAAAAIYNGGSPLNLTFNQGNYDNSSALQAYYRMGNGLFDDKANGIVHDQDNPGFGINLWDGANGDVTNWSPFGNNTVEEDDGTLKFTYVDNSAGPYIYLRDAYHLSDDLVVGATYELSITTKVNTGSVAWRLQHNSYPTYSFPSLTSTDFVTQSETFIATTAASHYLFVAAFGTGEIVWVKDITVRKLNGNPGLTSGGPTFSSDTP